MNDNGIIDLSSGDPGAPLTAVARHAFARSAAALGRYGFNNPNAPGNDRRLWEISKTVADHFAARGFTAPGWSGVPLTHLLLTGGGTTEGYELIVRHIAEDVRKANAQGRTIRPVMLMPVPTYGYFLDQPARHGIEVIKIALDLEAGGRLTPRQLHEAIQQVNDAGRRVVGFYAPNPHNPLGHVRGEQETRGLAAVIAAHNRRYESQDRHTQDVLHGGIAGRISIIDDMVYDGLEYGKDKAFGFAQVEEVYGGTLTLFGLSKVGLPGLRAGVVLAEQKKIWELMQLQRTCSYVPHTPALEAMAAFCARDGDLAAAREAYLQRQRQAYRFSGLFMKALISGLDDVPEARPADVKKMIGHVCRYRRCDEQQATNYLYLSLDKVRVITNPESGFFHVLDFSGLKNAFFQAVRVPGSGHERWVPAFDAGRDNTGLVLDAHGLKLACGEWMGVAAERMLWRASFAAQPRQILRFVERLDESLRAFKFPESDPRESIPSPLA